MDKDNKDMDTTNVVIFNNDHLRNKERENDRKETMDAVYMNMASDPEHLKKVWSHVCPNIGLIVDMDPVCSRCGKTKPKGKE